MHFLYNCYFFLFFHFVHYFLHYNNLLIISHVFLFSLSSSLLFSIYSSFISCISVINFVNIISIASNLSSSSSVFFCSILGVFLLIWIFFSLHPVISFLYYYLSKNCRCPLLYQTALSYRVDTISITLRNVWDHQGYNPLNIYLLLLSNLYSLFRALIHFLRYGIVAIYLGMVLLFLKFLSVSYDFSNYFYIAC